MHRGEIARRLHPSVSLQRALKISEADDFPPSVAVLGNWPIWIDADVKTWAEAHGRTWLTKDEADERDGVGPDGP